MSFRAPTLIRRGAHALSGLPFYSNFPSGPKNGCGPSKSPIGT
jgi:hypothetical protein